MSKTRDPKIRSAALRRDRWCVRCYGGHGGEVHHIASLCDGGEDTIDNVHLLCHSCHKEWHSVSEGSQPYEAFLDDVPARIIVHCARIPSLSNLSADEIRSFWPLARLNLGAARLGHKLVRNHVGSIEFSPFVGAEVVFDKTKWIPWADPVGDAVAYLAGVPAARIAMALRGSGRLLRPVHPGISPLLERVP